MTADKVVIEEPMTVADCAAAAGRSKDTIKRAIAAGRLRAHQPGGPRSPYVIQPSDFKQWLYGTPADSPHVQQTAADLDKLGEPGSKERLRALRGGKR